MSNRMPPISPDRMTEEQRRAAEELAAGPRGGLRGPFVPLLRSPELMDRLQKVGEYLRYRSALGARLREIAVLVVARYWTQQYEWSVHSALALQAGVGSEIVEAIAQGRRPSGMAADETIAYDFCDELLRTHGVSEATYRQAVTQLGEAGLMDLVGLLGYFTTLAMVMNMAQTPPPEGSRALLVPFPL